METSRPDFEKLVQVYALFDEVMGVFDTACREKCASCCTCNVTLTGLETAFLVSGLKTGQAGRMKAQLESSVPDRAYRPKMTANSFARVCMSGKEALEEENDPAWGSCPLLEDDTCTVYKVRPFGCRALMSEQSCARAGYAQMPPLALTLNHVFLQFVEHLDAGGKFGNLSDMLIAELSEGSDKRQELFLVNQKIPVLMVPPEHRQTLRCVIQKLSAIVSGSS